MLYLVCFGRGGEHVQETAICTDKPIMGIKCASAIAKLAKMPALKDGSLFMFCRPTDKTAKYPQF